MVKCVIISESAVVSQVVGEALTKDGITVGDTQRSLASLPAILSGPSAPRMVMVHLDANPMAGMGAVGALVRQYPAVDFFVVCGTTSSKLLMEAMHLGIKGFIPLPIDEEILKTAIERVTYTERGAKQGRIIHVVPMVGGCGATTIAINLATVLAMSDNKVVVVDMDLARGMVACAFDVQPRFTISDVMQSGERLDEQYVNNAVIAHKPTGLAILARPESCEEEARVTPTGVRQLLWVLKRMFDYVIVDSVMSFDSAHRAVLEAADSNVLVIQLNIPSVRNAERFMASMRRSGIDAEKTHVLVNRFVKKGSDIDVREVERVLEQKVAGLIPNDFRNVMDAMNYGEPVACRAPKSGIPTSLRSLVSELEGSASEVH